MPILQHNNHDGRLAHFPLKLPGLVTRGSTVGNNRQDPGPPFHLRPDKEDVVYAETGGFMFAAFEFWRNLVGLESRSGIMINIAVEKGRAGQHWLVSRSTPTPAPRVLASA